MKYSDLPATRTEAEKLSNRLFYTGEPCRSGHDSPRYTKTGCCKQCRTNDNRRNKERIARLMAKWNKAHPDYYREYRGNLDNRARIYAAVAKNRFKDCLGKDYNHDKVVDLFKKSLELSKKTDDRHRVVHKVHPRLGGLHELSNLVIVNSLQYSKWLTAVRSAK